MGVAKRPDWAASLLARIVRSSESFGTDAMCFWRVHGMRDLRRVQGLAVTRVANVNLNTNISIPNLAIGIEKDDFYTQYHLQHILGLARFDGIIYLENYENLFNQRTAQSVAAEAGASNEDHRHLHNTTREDKRYMAIITVSYFGAG
jgi:hypothetical protein